jgi:HAE1 family hydrophobic/amphiphilic exporter-1
MCTRMVEDSVSTVSHVEKMMSISKEGESTVVLTFERGINMEVAAMEVREKFAKVKEKLPKESEKPIIAQFSQTDVPIIIFAVTSRQRTTEELRKMVDENIRENIKRITGVANVEIGGGRERKIMIEPDENALFRYGVSVNRLISAIGGNNLDLLLGDVAREKGKVLIRAKGQYVDVNDIKNTAVLTRPDGSIVKVSDMAEVKDSYLEPSTYARINTSPIVSVYVQKETKANTIECAKGIIDELDQIKEKLPKDIKLIVTKNQSDFIRKSIANLWDALMRGAAMIILILMLFMGKLGKKGPAIILAGLLISALLPAEIMHYFLLLLVLLLLFVQRYRPILIVAIAIPISLIITFQSMDMVNRFVPGMNMTINFMTLFGLALAVGMLVDDAIVVFENIVTKSEHGLGPVEAATTGSTEMNMVIFSSTLTNVIVFLPMIFVSKSMSLLYGGVAWTVTFALYASLFVSLMIVPLMCSRTKLVEEGESKETKEGFLLPFYKFQEKAMLYAFRRRFMLLGVLAALFMFSLYLYGKMGKEYMGTTEQNRFTVFIEMPTGVKLDASDEVVRKVEGLLKEVPEVKDFTARVEGWSSKVYVNLVGLTERKRTVGEVIDSLRPKVGKFQPAFIYFEEEQEVGTKEIILNIFGAEYDILREIAIAMTTRMGKIPNFTDTKIRMREGRPELDLKVDKQKAAQYGFTTKDIADMVHAKVRGVRATLYHTKASEVETIVRMQEKDRRTVKDIHNLSIAKSGEDRAVLDQLVDFEYGLGPSEIWRMKRARMIQVSANIGQLPLGSAVEILKKEFSDLKLPEEYYYEIGGDYDELVKTQKEFILTITVILVLLYLVLASSFESYRQPFIIMSTVLLATIGAIGALYLCKLPIGMGALIGMMMLAGIVVKNGIILVDHTNLLKTRRKNLYRILLQAGGDRLRPVLMTAAATMMGLVPMALDRSEGSNLWRPLAITVIGGMGFATPLTLIIVPVTYSIFENFGDRVVNALKWSNIRTIMPKLWSFTLNSVKKMRFSALFPKKSNPKLASKDRLPR